MKRRFLLFVSALLTAVGALAQASIILETLPESSVGQTAVLSMSLDNKEVVKGFQADVTLPDFITFNNVAPQMTAHAQAFDVAYRRISEHQMRIVVSSATNGKLQADSAAVVSFNVAVANVEDATGEVIKVTQAAAILENYRKVEIPDTAFQALAVKPSFVIRYVVDGEECYRDTLMQGEAIQPLATPTKEGHTFSGWSEIPAMMPAQDVTVAGTFTVNRYRLTYTLDGEEYSADSIAYGTTLVQKDALTKEGYTFSGWSELPATMPAGDVTVTGTFTVNRYLLTYTLDGEEFSKDSIAYGTPLVQKDSLTREGYTFSGWSELPATMPAQDVTVTGTFTVNRYLLTYTLDGEEYSADSIAYGTPLVQKETQTKEGYTFSGWSELPATMPAQDVTVTGTFTVNRYRVTYILEGDTLRTDSVAYGTVIPTPEVPARPGYNFKGWEEVPATMPAQDITLNGEYTINKDMKYNLIYMVDGVEYMREVVPFGDSIKVEAAPIKEGHTFSGWSEVPQTMPLHDVTVTGTFTANRYTLLYILDGEEFSKDSIAYGTPLVQKDALTKEGYTFSGWSELPATMPAGDVTVTGTFTVNRYRLTYTLDGEEYSADSIAYGTPLVQKETLTKEGYTFSGWSEIPATMPAGDVTVAGTFTVNKYKVTAVVILNGITLYTVSDSITYGTAVPHFEIPAIPGYTLAGWENLPESMPAQDVIITAILSVNHYKLTYMVDGEEVYTDSIAYRKEVTVIEEPTKEGHTFSGWSEIPETMPAGDVTVTGTFTINKYLLTFVSDGEILMTDSVTYGTALPIPTSPEKEGYTFSGWGEMAEVMPAQDLTYTAIFTLNEEQTDGQGLTYLLNGTKDAFAVSGYTDALVSEVIVPETLYGLPVNAMLNGALEDANVLKSITLPASVEGVGEGVFCGCRNLLVVEWNATAPLLAGCFDDAEEYGNMLVFATGTASSVTFEGNVVTDGIAEEITLTDGMPFRNPKQFTARHISYSREFTKKTKVGMAGGWEGIVLPFKVQTITNEEKGTLSPFGAETEGLPCWIAEWQTSSKTFALSHSNLANQPFIMEVPNSEDYEEEFNIEGKVTFEAENTIVYATTDMVPVTGNGYSLQGTYEGVDADSYVYALNDEEYVSDDSNETFLPGGVFVSNSRGIRPFEAYIYNNLLTRSRYLPIQGGTAQGIDRWLLKNPGDDDSWYTLQGVRLNGKPMQKGMYIHGGKKVMVR